MNFKKDYINYVLHSVIHSNGRDTFVLSYNPSIIKILEKIISADDIFKVTFLIGKTAGLELLFKYLLYISDKIDKSQITIFNLKDNFEYDVQKLKKICEKVDKFKNSSISKPLEKIEEKKILEEKKSSGTIKIDIEHLPADNIHTGESEIISQKEDAIKDEYSEEAEETEEHGLTLIENVNASNKENEVFELTDINESASVEEEKVETKSQGKEESPPAEEKMEEEDIDLIIQAPKEETEEVYKQESIEEQITEGKIPSPDIKKIVETIDFEFEIKEPLHKEEEVKHDIPLIKEESVTNEAYLKFENKFFEEVKILEKLFYNVTKESGRKSVTKINDRMLQSITEIIEISSELADLTRQLSFDLTADIFYTINLFFTKTIKSPVLMTYEKIKLLESSLSLVNSLIRGKDYLNYDAIVEEIEKLKEELTRPSEKVSQPQMNKEFPMQDSKMEHSGIMEEMSIDDKTNQNVKGVLESTEPGVYNTNQTEEPEPDRDYRLPQGDFDTIIFKMKHFVKDFEKKFVSLGNIKGEYSRFDALERIDDLNNSLRMIAKISSSVKMNDVLKLSEVSYVFLKYLKDYRMDLLDSEIQQIIKYIIFTFKMLLTDRKPEDFNMLVQYLNNPVKIFTDSN